MNAFANQRCVVYSTRRITWQWIVEIGIAFTDCMHHLCADSKVSAQSFFQTNPRQTEVLYSLAAKEAQLNNDGTDVVLDLYCGTGTIGLSVARGCREVHGFELNESAVRDAKRNAERNGIANAHFHQ
eukprot:scaffold184146_cov22-Prasinocladus_malaysianus.AAC.1